LRAWCKRTELTQENSSVNLSEHERLKQLERENTELKRAKEILRKAVAFFAQAELDRKPN
jgi:transposase